MSTSSILFGLLFGSIGLGFFVYGKKQRATVPLVCGLALLVVPYFVANVAALIIVGALLVAAPFFVKM